MNNTHSILLIIIIAGITGLLRFAPFILFGGKRPVPKIITYLSNALPAAIIGMLIIYCLRNVDFLGGWHGLPEIIAIAAVVVLHVWKKNTVLSIAGGTVLYMILVQMIFC